MVYKKPICEISLTDYQGMLETIESRVPFVVVSPDSVDDQQKLCQRHSFKFRMISCKENSFHKDMRMISMPGDLWEKKYGLPPGKPTTGKMNENS